MITKTMAAREPSRAALLSRYFLHPQIELTNEIVVVELIGGAAFESDLAVHDDVAAIGDADGLCKVLLGHQDGELVMLRELLDGVDGTGDQQRRETNRRFVNQQDARAKH